MQRDPYELNRFVDAQSANYADALAELRAGRKQSHWSWYVFPQVRGLGSSPMSVRYAIGSRAEASAFLAHPVLGSRLRECVKAMNAHRGLSAVEILGDIDVGMDNHRWCGPQRAGLHPTVHAPWGTQQARPFRTLSHRF